MYVCHNISYNFIVVENQKGKVKAQKSELFPVSLAWSMPRSIATPPLDGMIVHRRFTLKQYVAGIHIYTWVKRDKVE